MMLAINGGKKLRTRLFPAQYYGLENYKIRIEIEKILNKGILSNFRGSWQDEFWGGEWVRAFEKKVRKDLGGYAISCNSCTSALQIACGAIGLQPGDEVIVTPWSMSCSATAPMVYGAVPVFADIEYEYFCLRPESVESFITERTKAIIAVGLFGQMFSEEILKIAKKYNLYVIEDAAQAIGSTMDGKPAGTFGDIGCFSFTQGKHLSAGEGGLCVMNDEELAFKCALIRNHSEAVENSRLDNDLSIDGSSFGFNMRMTEIQAMILWHQWDLLDSFVKMRRDNVKELDFITEIPFILKAEERPGCVHSYYVQPFYYDNDKAPVHRDVFIEAVKAELTGERERPDRPMIGAGYIKPLYLFPVFQEKKNYVVKDYLYPEGLCPRSEKLWKGDFFLSMYHGLPLEDEDIQDIISAFMKVYDNIGDLMSPGGK